MDTYEKSVLLDYLWLKEGLRDAMLLGSENMKVLKKQVKILEDYPSYRVWNDVYMYFKDEDTRSRFVQEGRIDDEIIGRYLGFPSHAISVYLENNKNNTYCEYGVHYFGLVFASDENYLEDIIECQRRYKIPDSILSISCLYVSKR